MKVYLIRHAEAVALGEQGITDDAERPLTDVGEQQSRIIAKGLLRTGIRLDKLLTSPLVRAKQTTDLLIRNWDGPPPEVVECDELAPDVRLKKLARALRRVNSENIGLVGHNPQLALFAAWLIGSKKTQIDLAKAGVACIDFEDALDKGMGTLEWLVPPEWFKE